MITGIHGKCTHVTDDTASVDIGGITVAVMVSPAVSDRLTMSGTVGDEISLHTYMYIEGGVGMGNLVPRLVGFVNESDLEFFHLLTTVQGLSVKKSLKALAIPVKEMARAIELNDVATLKKLPEVGQKTAQKIVMELKGKVAKFALLREEEIAAASTGSSAGDAFHREALEILRQLQYSDSEAEELLQAAVKRRPDISSAEELIQELFRNHIDAQ